MSRVGLRNGHPVQHPDDPRPIIRSAVGPPAPQRSSEQQVERESRVAEPLRPGGARAQAPDQCRVGPYVVVQRFDEPGHPSLVQVGQVDLGGLAQQALHGVGPSRLERFACSQEQALAALGRRARQLRRALDAGHRRHHRAAAKRIGNCGHERFGNVVVRSDQRLRTVPDLAVPVGVQHLRQGRMGRMTPLQGFVLQDARANKGMPEDDLRSILGYQPGGNARSKVLA